MLCIKIYWPVVYAVKLILTKGILREFVMRLKVIIYAKQNGAQLATFAATGTRAAIDVCVFNYFNSITKPLANNIYT